MNTTPKAKPFLKWAGGKQKLLPELLKRVPASYRVYREPFLGGGALFFALAPKRAVLSDINPDLVSTYLAVKSNVKDVISLLKVFEEGHTKRGLAHYLEIRAWNAGCLDTIGVAARMIYLNKTCFNGLWRVNKKGQFNVPMGRFASPPTICDEENLWACSAALQDADLWLADFRGALFKARKSDFVYLDPPYVPVSKTSNFTSYTKEGFGELEQGELAAVARTLDSRKVHLLLSNAGSQKVVDLYPSSVFKIEEVAMRRNINCVGDSRGKVSEYLITGKMR